MPKNILAIDLGERVMATVCDSLGNIRFLGRTIRGIRTHFAYLRKKLGEKKLLAKIKAIGQKERNKVQQILHAISNEIISLAKKHYSTIVLGELKGMRKRKWSKKLNRMLFTMPFYTLTRMIQYKAEQQGISVEKISEYNTSITCHRCGNVHKEQRKSQGLFTCHVCKIEYNADLNAARNILHRAKEQDFLARAMAYAQKSAVQTS